MSTVLVVDDDPLFVEQLTKALQRAGLNPLGAATSNAALAIIDERDDIACLVSDIRMREDEPQGFLLARMARRRRPSLPIVLVTVHPPYTALDDFGRVMLKEEGLDAIVGEVRAQLSRKPFLDPR